MNSHDVIEGGAPDLPPRRGLRVAVLLVGAVVVAAAVAPRVLRSSATPAPARITDSPSATTPPLDDLPVIEITAVLRPAVRTVIVTRPIGTAAGDFRSGRFLDTANDDGVAVWQIAATDSSVYVLDKGLVDVFSREGVAQPAIPLPEVKAAGIAVRGGGLALVLPSGDAIPYDGGWQLADRLPPPGAYFSLAVSSPGELRVLGADGSYARLRVRVPSPNGAMPPSPPTVVARDEGAIWLRITAPASLGNAETVQHYLVRLDTTARTAVAVELECDPTSSLDLPPALALDQSRQTAFCGGVGFRTDGGLVGMLVRYSLAALGPGQN